MKRLLLVCLAFMTLSLGITSCASGATAQPRKTDFPDNAFQEIPEEYFKMCKEGGIVMKLDYETKNYNRGDQEFEKTAYVYLPYGYDGSDTETKYNVFYLMHGGGGSEKDYFGGTMQDTQMKCLIDNMIANGDMEPCIVVTPSYNNPYDGDATSCCKHFYAELVNDLIPAVEGKYNTYCEKTTKKGIQESRLHRGFGGFSMGGGCTWWVFEYALKEVGYFMPISGDSWTLAHAGGASMPRETAEYLANVVKDHGFTKDDFYIYAGTGTNDMALPNMDPMINEMKKLTDTFVYCDNFKDGNLYFAIREGGWHDGNTIMRIVYNGLPKFFG